MYFFYKLCKNQATLFKAQVFVLKFHMQTCYNCLLKSSHDVHMLSYKDEERELWS